MTLLGEIIGTGILVFIGCLSCVGSMGIVAPNYQISMSFGLAVMIAIQVNCIKDLGEKMFLSNYYLHSVINFIRIYVIINI